MVRLLLVPYLYKLLSWCKSPFNFSFIVFMLSQNFISVKQFFCTSLDSMNHL